MELNSRLALTKQRYEEVPSLVSLDDLNSEAYPTDESRLVLKELVFKLVRELGILDRHYGIRNFAPLIPNQNVAPSLGIWQACPANSQPVRKILAISISKISASV